GVLAERVRLGFAGATRTARDRKWHDDAVADGEVLHGGTDLDHLAHELVAHDVARFHHGEKSVVEMKVGAADRGGRDLHDAVLMIEDRRVRYLADLHVPGRYP